MASELIAKALALARELVVPGTAYTAADVFALVGAAVLGASLLRCALGALGATARALTPGKRLTSYGQWAVVTGATDGIGKAYAKALAKRGLSVVLISRTEQRLKEAAAEIQAAAPTVGVKTIVADFTKSVESGLYDGIKKGLEGLEVGILINNVGMSYPGALYFHELAEHAPTLPRDMVHINVDSVTQMTALVLPGMVARKRGAIVNIASAAGRIPTGNPMYAAYSASKAYVDFFSRSLHREYAPKGVWVSCQSPYFVASKMSKIRAASLFTPSPDGWARAAVGAIGAPGGDADSTVPYGPHAVQDWVLRSLPRWAVTSYVMGLHASLRAKYLKKVAKDGKAQ